MDKVAILLTCHNRKEKTISCLRSLEETYITSGVKISCKIYLTDDGSTDGTSEEVSSLKLIFPIKIIQGDGSLFWNKGMNKSWLAALEDGDFDGFLWLNDDTIVLKDFWMDLINTDNHSKEVYGKGGIYVGSTKDTETKEFSYGGFNYLNTWKLPESFVHPDGHTFQECQCAHGNITFVSRDVSEKMGILYDGYIHSVSDHDYTYRTYKKGYPVLVMPHYCGECENNHIGLKRKGKDFCEMTIKERIAFSKSPFGYNLHNTLLFQKRCFPHRLIFVWIIGLFRVIFPNITRKMHQ